MKARVRHIHHCGLLVALLLVCRVGTASKLEKGFEALSHYDYFKAKELFSAVNKSAPNTYASYGLAIIFSRNTNPFYNADSAGKYVCLSYNLFTAEPKIVKLSGMLIDGAAILKLADSIAVFQLQQLKKQHSITQCDRFLQEYYIVSEKIKNEVAYLRDEQEFNAVLSANKSDTTHEFLNTHPQSEFFIEATLLKDRQLYDETTPSHTAEAYKRFLKKYPHNVMVNTAYDKLFQLYRQGSDAKGLSDFVRAYPKAPQNLEAWKLLFSLTVKSFSNDELSKFLEEHPDFPLKNSILKELELNRLTLYPCERNELFGFVTTEGRFAIVPEYDAASQFYEGLSVVSKNDSVFFINKENSNVFHTSYADAYVFRYGIAPVKQGSKWLFINRLGQNVSRSYDEISELSDGVYVVKLGDKYGAVDQFGEALVELKYNKLGDFKNGFAYYAEDGKYGFISKVGGQHKAEFDWISDFDDSGIAVFKQADKFGLVHHSGTRLLEPQYDQVLKANGIFIVVQGANYGFFSAAGCFLSPVIYEFSKEKAADYYTDGELLKLLRKGEQALADKNGRVLLPFGSYAEVNFFSAGLMRVKKTVKGEARYGYLDRRLGLAIACKYEQAGDFADSLAIVELKGKFMLIDGSGQEVYVSTHELTKIAPHHYLEEDTRQVLDQQGRQVFNGVASVQKIKPGLQALILNSGEVKLLYD